MKLKLENDFEKGIVTLLAIFAYICLLAYYFSSGFQIIWFSLVLVGLIRVIWTNK
mgnify:CR=1 FL=1